MIIWIVRVVAAGTVYLFSAQGPLDYSKNEQIAFCEGYGGAAQVEECEFMRQ